MLKLARGAATGTLFISMLLLLVGRAAGADPVVYRASGPTRESIQPTVDKFKYDILYGINSESIATGWYKLATFEDVGSSSPVTTVVFSSGGIDFSPSPTTTLVVSAGAEETPDSSLLFGDLNPKYRQSLQAFSGRSVLAGAAVAGNCCGGSILGRVPDATSVNAFGAVFIDPDFDNVTGMEISGSGPPDVRHNFAIPAAPGDGNFTFFGVIFDRDDTLSVLHLTLSTIQWGTAPSNETPALEIVAVDDVILGFHPIPEPRSWVLIVVAGALLPCAFSTLRVASGTSPVGNS